MMRKIVISYRDLSLSIHHIQQLKYSLYNDWSVRRQLQKVEDYLTKLKERYDEYTETHEGPSQRSLYEYEKIIWLGDIE